MVQSSLPLTLCPHCWFQCTWSARLAKTRKGAAWLSVKMPNFWWTNGFWEVIDFIHCFVPPLDLQERCQRRKDNEKLEAGLLTCSGPWKCSQIFVRDHVFRGCTHKQVRVSYRDVSQLHACFIARCTDILRELLAGAWEEEKELGVQWWTTT